MIDLCLLLSGGIVCRLNGVLSDCCDDVIWLPFIGWIPLDDLAIFTDEDRRQGVSEGLAVPRRHTYVEELSDGREIFYRWGREVPMSKPFVGVVPRVGTAVTA